MASSSSPTSFFPDKVTDQTSRGYYLIERLWVATVLVGLPLLYFLPAIINNLTLVPGDGLSQNLGVRVLIGQMIRNGHLPLWNPYIFAGTPLLASVYPGAIYPPNWIFALFAPA